MIKIIKTTILSLLLFSSTYTTANTKTITTATPTNNSKIINKQYHNSTISAIINELLPEYRLINYSDIDTTNYKTSLVVENQTIQRTIDTMLAGLNIKSFIYHKLKIIILTK